MPTQGIAIELSDQQALSMSKTARLLHVSEFWRSAADLVLSKDQEPCRRLPLMRWLSLTNGACSLSWSGTDDAGFDYFSCFREIDGHFLEQKLGMVR